MSALDEWKSLDTFDVTLPSGVRVKARYHSMELMLLSGNIDMAVMRDMQKASDTPIDKLEPGERDRLISEGIRLKHATVKIHTLAVSGEEVHLTDEDLAALPEADLAQLARYIDREDPVPLEQDRSSGTSSDSPNPNGHGPTLPSATAGESIPQPQ